MCYFFLTTYCDLLIIWWNLPANNHCCFLFKEVLHMINNKREQKYILPWSLKNVLGSKSLASRPSVSSHTCSSWALLPYGFGCKPFISEMKTTCKPQQKQLLADKVYITALFFSDLKVFLKKKWASPKWKTFIHFSINNIKGKRKETLRISNLCICSKLPAYVRHLYASMSNKLFQIKDTISLYH